jgi:hypothetical protein
MPVIIKLLRVGSIFFGFLRKEGLMRVLVKISVEKE